MLFHCVIMLGISKSDFAAIVKATGWTTGYASCSDHAQNKSTYAIKEIQKNCSTSKEPLSTAARRALIGSFH